MHFSVATSQLSNEARFIEPYLVATCWYEGQAENPPVFFCSSLLPHGGGGLLLQQQPQYQFSSGGFVRFMHWVLSMTLQL